MNVVTEHTRGCVCLSEKKSQEVTPKHIQVTTHHHPYVMKYAALHELSDHTQDAGRQLLMKGAGHLW